MTTPAFIAPLCRAPSFLSLLLLPAILGGASPAAAHDFWIQPESWCVTPGQPMPFTLQVGHGGDRQRSALRAARVVRFDVTGPDGETPDLLGRLALGQEAVDGLIDVSGPGSHVLAFQTDHHAESHLSAARFNAYLREEGLTPALVRREQAGRTETDGSESYGRIAKALLQAGPVPDPVGDPALRPAGLPLEIVPETNPYQASRSPDLPVRVYWRSRPLAGALVKLTDLDDDARPRESQVTDRLGRARFDVPLNGRWVLNVVWTSPLPADRETEFETTFSSLTFGCRS